MRTQITGSPVTVGEYYDQRRRESTKSVFVDTNIKYRLAAIRTRCIVGVVVPLCVLYVSFRAKNKNEPCPFYSIRISTPGTGRIEYAMSSPPTDITSINRDDNIYLFNGRQVEANIIVTADKIGSKIEIELPAKKLSILKF